jgi:hypothetical protein
MQRNGAAVAGLAALALAGCAGPQPVGAFAGQTPAFHLEDFYAGHSKGYGFFFSRGGRVVKQFTADENGTWDGHVLHLHEHYVFSDGKTQDRDWIYTKTADGTWIGRTPEVVGVTTGSEAGNAYRMHYTFDLTKSGSNHTVDFDDWSWMVAPKIMLNRATGTKFGIGIGEIQAVFIHD